MNLTLGSHEECKRTQGKQCLTYLEQRLENIEKINVTKWNKRYEFVESHDRPRPVETWHIDAKVKAPFQ